MSIFKAYDIRGIYPTQLDDELAYRIGRAFVTYTKAKAVLVGQDSRLSSMPLARELMRGITDQGADVVDIGLSTTPMHAFVQAHIGYETAVQVTASHNPKEYGGFKLYGKGPSILTGEKGIPQIRELAEKGEFEESHHKGTMLCKDHLFEYLDFLQRQVHIPQHSLRIVVDASNGPASRILAPLLDSLGIDYIGMNMTPDGNFPGHDPNPLKGECQAHAGEAVRKHTAAFGCLFDADADRVIFVDEQGKGIQPDFIAAMIAESFLKKHPGEKVVMDCVTSRSVSETVQSAGGVPIVTRVGRAFLIERMQEEQAVFGAEVSSHYYFRDLFYNDGGILMLLKVIELVATRNRPLSELVKPYARYVSSGEINITVKDKEESLAALKEECKDAKFSHLDGLGVEYPEAWCTVRGSNTEPLLRIYAEGRTKESMEALKERVLRAVK